MSCYEGYINELRSLGFRLTPQRVLILEALFHDGEHLTVEDVYSYVHERNAKVNLSTVYRSLNFLASQGLITELHRGTDPTLYAAVKETPHAHAVCQRCGVVLPVDATMLEPVLAQITSLNGFQVMLGRVELPGLCQSCAS